MNQQILMDDNFKQKYIMFKTDIWVLRFYSITITDIKCFM